MAATESLQNGAVSVELAPRLVEIKPELITDPSSGELRNRVILVLVIKISLLLSCLTLKDYNSFSFPCYRQLLGHMIDAF